jgi:hypothetical protein
MRPLGTIDQIKPRSRIVYNDGRAGHSGIFADVLSVDSNGMMVQFEDRADRTRINFSDRAWMDFIELSTES